MQKILVVDDEEKMRGIYKKLLGFENYEVMEAKDAVEAMKLLGGRGGERIDLVLLDIQMPLVNGATLYEVIRKRYGQSVKIVVSSVYPLEEQQRRITQADDYFDKSQGTQVLLSKVRTVLQQGGKS